MARENAPLVADETTMLIGYLDFYRETMVQKVEGLTEDQSRWRPAPTANSLLNLIWHLAGVERWWFQGAIAGIEISRDREKEFEELPPDVTIDAAVAAYRREWERGSEIVRSLESLDDRCRNELVGDRTVRWVLLHMLEETARHAGHADITRELLDGSVGS